MAGARAARRLAGRCRCRGGLADACLTAEGAWRAERLGRESTRFGRPPSASSARRRFASGSRSPCRFPRRRAGEAPPAPPPLTAFSRLLVKLVEVGDVLVPAFLRRVAFPVVHVPLRCCDPLEHVRRRSDRKIAADREGPITP